MPTIYRKTAKGVTEIATREHRLVPRARTVLLLVDGKRDVDELRSLISQQADETLAMLVQQGFVEAAGEPVAGAPVSPVSPPAPAPTTAPAPGSAAPAAGPVPGAAASAAAFTGRRQAAVRELNDTLGPSGSSLAIRMERARDAAEMRPLVQMAAQIIANARGRAVGEAYAARHEF
jgi:hypothetical protein